MTERQAWLKLARLWGDAVEGPESDCWVVCIDDETCYGLCQSVWAQHPSIPESVGRSMLDKIKAKPRGRGFSGRYCWPNTKAGAAKRAAFCRKMAEKCGPAKSKGVTA